MRKRHISQNPQPPRLAVLARRARWAVRFCLALPLLTLFVAVVLYCVHLSRLLLANLSPIVASAVTRQTGHETRLGRIEFPSPGVVSINSVAVSSRATFADSHGEAVLRADRIQIHYALHSLLLDPANAAHALGDIDVDHPTALVERLAKNKFNFSNIIKPSPNKHAKPFQGQVIVKDGTLRFRDYLAPAQGGPRPALNTVQRVYATVNLHSAHIAYFTVDGLGAANRFQRAFVSGAVSRTVAGRFRISANVRNADAPYWSSYFSTLRQARVTAGQADLDLTVARLGSRPPPGLPVDLLGSVSVRRGAIAWLTPDFRRLGLRGVTGTATFTGSGVTFAATGGVNGQPAAASGSVFDFAHPTLALTVNVPRLDLQPLAAQIPSLRWPRGLTVAPGTALVHAVGRAAAPTISAVAAFPSLQYDHNQIFGVTGAGVFTGHTLSLSHVSARLSGGGAAALHGTLLLTTGQMPRLELGGQAIGVNLASLHLPLKSPIAFGGIGNVQFLASSIGQPMQVVADVAVARPRVARTALLAARARIVYQQGRGVTISRALVRAPQGALLAGGTLPSGPHGAWNMHVDAAGLNLASLLGPYSKAPLGGLAYFQGIIFGAAAAPTVAGQVQLINAHYARFTTDVVRGGVAVSSRGLRFDDLTLDRFPTLASVSGTIAAPAAPNPLLALRVQVSQADLLDFLSLARQFAPAKSATLFQRLPPLTGTAEGMFTVGGSLRNPQVAGQATVTDGTVGAYRLDRLHVAASYQHGLLNVADASAAGEGASAQAHGQADLTTGALNVALAVQNLNLDQLRAVTDTYADAHGILGASAAVSGSLAHPRIAATLTGQELSVNGQRLAPLTLSGQYADGFFQKTGLPWTLDILPASQGGSDIRYVVNSLRLLLPTPQHPRRTPAIALDAAIPADAPESISHIIESVRQSRFASTPAGARLLARVNSLPQPLDGTLAVPKLSVQGPLSDPTVAATVQGTNLVIGPNKLASVTADATFSNPKNPSATLELTAADFTGVDIPIGSLTAHASLADHVFTLSNLRALNADAFLEASGTADLKPGGSLTASLDASNIPLAFFDPLLPQPAVERRSLTGQIGTLSVSATGPTDAPNLVASVSLAKPGLAIGSPGKPPSVSYSLQRIRSGAITVSTPVQGGPQILTITDLAAFQGGRPIASLSGSVPFRWPSRPAAAPTPPAAALSSGQPLHAQLVVQDLSQIAPFFPGLDAKHTAGTLTADVDVSPGEGPDNTTGELNLTGGAVALNGFDTALTKVQAHVLLAGDKLKITNLSALSTKGGSLTLTGGSDLTLSHADLRIAANALTIDESSRHSLLSQMYGADFRGKINGALQVVGPWLTPLVSTLANAPLTVTDAAGTIPSAPASPAAPSAPSVFDPRFAMTVQLGGKNKTITATNALLRADANGNVDLTGSLSAPNLRAHLNIVRGQLILPPSTRLKFVQSASGNIVDVRYPVPSADGSGTPSLRTEVDLTAQASVSISQSQLASFRGLGEEEAAPQIGVGAAIEPLTAPAAGVTFTQPQSYVITAHIHGYLNDPNLAIDLSSTPGGLSRQDMLVALTGVAGLQGLSSQSALQAELADALTSVGLPAFLSPLEDSIAASLNLSDFDIAYSPDAPVLVTLGKEILPRLNVTYQRFLGNRSNEVTAVGQPPEYDLQLNYQLTHGLQLSVSTDDQNDDTVALQGVASF